MRNDLPHLIEKVYALLVPVIAVYVKEWPEAFGLEVEGHLSIYAAPDIYLAGEILALSEDKLDRGYVTRINIDPSQEPLPIPPPQLSLYLYGHPLCINELDRVNGAKEEDEFSEKVLTKLFFIISTRGDLFRM